MPYISKDSLEQLLRHNYLRNFAPKEDAFQLTQGGLAAYQGPICL